jgi:hypothetical protein
MTTAADLRNQALALPDTQEGSHFRLPAFRVCGAVYVVLQSEHHAVLHVDAETAAAAEAAHAAVERTYRGRTLVGVRVHLPDLAADDLRTLLTAAWRHRAPKALRAQGPQ